MPILSYRRRLAGLGAAVAPAQSIQAMVQATAVQLGVDPSLALAVAAAESGFNPNAVSSAGAIGVMQLMPATAAQMGVSNPLDPQQNITGGLRYLSMLIGQFGGNVAQALAAYNWGPGNVQNAIAQLGTNWAQALPNETLDYVSKICTQTACGSGLTPAPASTPVPVDPGDGSTSTFYAAIGPPAGSAGSGVDFSTVFLLAAGALGAYLLADSVLN